MRRVQILAAGLGIGLGIHALRRHLAGAGTAMARPGGIVMGDASGYESMSRLLLGSLFEGIATDVARALPPRATLLEVGCGPGHLATRLAAHGLRVTGIDFDERMIERARASARARSHETEPEFKVADVAALPLPDASFDAVVSTLSMHHWADPASGLREIARVLRPGGRVLIWDIRPGAPLHGHVGDPLDRFRGAPLRLVSMSRWRWPWRLSLVTRYELELRDAAVRQPLRTAESANPDA